MPDTRSWRLPIPPSTRARTAQRAESTILCAGSSVEFWTRSMRSAPRVPASNKDKCKCETGSHFTHHGIDDDADRRMETEYGHVMTQTDGWRPKPNMEDREAGQDTKYMRKTSKKGEKTLFIQPMSMHESAQFPRFAGCNNTSVNLQETFLDLYKLVQATKARKVPKVPISSFW